MQGGGFIAAKHKKASRKRAEQQQTNQAETALARGKDREKANDWSGAIHECTTAIELDPKNHEALRQRALAYRKLNRFQEAEQDYERSLKLCDNDYTRRLRAQLYLEWKKVDKAEADLHAAVKLCPTTWAFNSLGQLYRHHRKDHDKALPYYAKAADMDPKWWVPLCNKGHCLVWRGELNLALLNFTKSISLLTKETEAAGHCVFLYRGDVYKKMSRLHEAMQDYLRAIQLDPLDHDTYFTAGLLCEEMKQWDRAMEMFGAAISLLCGKSSSATTGSSTLAQCYEHRAAVYTQTSRHEAALQDLKMAHSEDVQSSRILRLMGDTLVLLGNFTEAIRAYSFALFLNTESSPALYGRGNAFFHLGDYESAISNVERAIAINKDIDTMHLLQQARQQATIT